MKTVLSAIVVSTFLAAPAFAIEPIQGSMTYNEPSNATLTKSPVGSVIQHQFTSNGTDYRELYVVGNDGRPQLVTRDVANNS